jgi:hypothetical protein
MSKFVELSHKVNGKKFFINTEYVTNVHQHSDGATVVCLMPHLESSVDPDNVALPPFIAIVEGDLDEVMAKLNG